MVVDAHSKWPEVCEASNATTETTVAVLQNLFSRLAYQQS